MVRPIEPETPVNPELQIATLIRDFQQDPYLNFRRFSNGN
jgi:hypothetical protein